MCVCVKVTCYNIQMEIMFLICPISCFSSRGLCSSETVASSQKTALESQAKQMKELDDTNSTLKADLQRARSNHSNEQHLKEKVAELEGCVDNLNQKNLQLQVQSSNQHRCPLVNGLLVANHLLVSVSSMKIYSSSVFSRVHSSR